ncbi:hypothetical protein GW17_00046188, partial [Ensete ventricosum]
DDGELQRMTTKRKPGVGDVIQAQRRRRRQQQRGGEDSGSGTKYDSGEMLIQATATAAKTAAARRRRQRQRHQIRQRLDANPD